MNKINSSDKYKDLFKFLILIKPYWKNIRIFIFSNIIVTLLTLPLPWFSKILIDDVMLKQDSSLLIAVILTPFFISIAAGVLTFLKGYYILYMQHAMSFDIQFKFYKRLQQLSFSFYDKKEVAEILSRFRDASTSRQLLVDIISSFTTNILYLTIVPFIVFLMNWKLALIAGFTLPWMAFSFFILSRIVKKYAREVAEKQAEISVANFETLSGIREVQSLAIESRVLRRIKYKYLQFRKLDMTMKTFTTGEALISTLMTVLGTAFYTWYGATLVIGGQMTVGEFTAFTVFVGYLYNPLTAIVGLLVPIQETLVLTKRFFEYYDLESEVGEKPKAQKKKDIRGHIEFESVNFGYSLDKLVLKDINLDILPGTTVAVVGTTGSGKSSFVNLLPRFYDVTHGVVKIDGIDVRDLSLNSLRNAISMVMQHPFSFVGSIYDNIVCYRKGVRPEQVIDAAKIAQAHRFISDLPDGYNTLVGEKGVTLSGGERQRIALARAILLDRPILILDEATSNLDLKTEALVQEALRNVTSQKTVFIIAHRLSTIMDADLILVIDQGRIVEKGKHKDLLKKKGVYHELYTGKRSIGSGPT